VVRPSSLVEVWKVTSSLVEADLFESLKCSREYGMEPWFHANGADYDRPIVIGPAPIESAIFS